MQVGLAPTLTVTEKTSLKRWIDSALRHARFAPGSWPLGAKIAVYIDGVALQTYNGYWNTDGQRLHIGGDTTDGRLANVIDRLAILGAIISAAELWTELADAYSTAVSKALLESYNTAMSGMVRTRQGVPTGLAFSADRQQVAAKFGETWNLPNGVPVEVDATWVVVQ